MVTVIARWQVKSGELNQLKTLLARLVPATRQEPGNLAYQVYHQPEDSSAILLFEQYKDHAALAVHRETEHFKLLVLKEILPLLESRSVQVLQDAQVKF